MAVALVDMERVFIPPQHFIRLVQRRYVRVSLLKLQAAGSLELKERSLDSFGWYHEIRNDLWDLLRVHRMERAQKLDTLQGVQSKKAQEAEQSLLSKVGVSISTVIFWIARFSLKVNYVFLLGVIVSSSSVCKYNVAWSDCLICRGTVVLILQNIIICHCALPGT